MEFNKLSLLPLDSREIEDMHYKFKKQVDMSSGL